MPQRESSIGTMTVADVDQPQADDLTVLSPEDAPAIVAQTELTGDVRTYEIGQGKIHLGDNPSRFTAERVVRIVVGLNTATGEHIARPLAETSLNGLELSHLPLAQYGVVYDIVEAGSPSVNTARKGGASRPFVDTNAAVIARGGNPNYRIRKPEHSFGLPNTYKLIYGETPQPEPVPVTTEEPDDLKDLPF